MSTRIGRSEPANAHRGGAGQQSRQRATAVVMQCERGACGHAPAVSRVVLGDPQLVLEGDVGALLSPPDAAALVLVSDGGREVRLLDFEDLQRLHVLPQLLCQPKRVRERFGRAAG